METLTIILSTITLILLGVIYIQARLYSSIRSDLKLEKFITHFLESELLQEKRKQDLLKNILRAQKKT
jgi:cell division protein FtsX